MNRSSKKNTSPSKASGFKVIAQNKRAHFDYEILEKFEAGIQLTGSEIKSIRQGRVNLSAAYATVQKEEVFLMQAEIQPYDKGGYANHEPKRKRKLLLHRKEIEYLIGKTQTKGQTLVPTKLYLKNGYAKVELGLGVGKKTHDKRATIKEREVKRSLDKAMKRNR
jgi:SsrA-binding protein